MTLDSLADRHGASSAGAPIVIAACGVLATLALAASLSALGFPPSRLIDISRALLHALPLASILTIGLAAAIPGLATMALVRLARALRTGMAVRTRLLEISIDF